MAIITGPGQQTPQGGLGNKVPSGYKAGRLQNFTPEMMQLFQQMIEQLGPESFISRLASGDPEMFAEMEAPALRQFNEVIGGIGSKFSGMGSGARRSSGFQHELTSKASNFAQELQAKRLGLQKEGIEDMMSYANQLLSQRPYEQYLTKKQHKPSFMDQLLGTGKDVLGLVKGFGF